MSDASRYIDVISQHYHLQACFFFFFNDTATTEIYTLSLHDALPILLMVFVITNDLLKRWSIRESSNPSPSAASPASADRKSTRLNSSHSQISYAVFCLKKKKSQHTSTLLPSHLSSSITRCTPLPH